MLKYFSFQIILDYPDYGCRW